MREEVTLYRYQMEGTEIEGYLEVKFTPIKKEKK